MFFTRRSMPPFLFLLLCTGAARAANPGGMSDEQMQQMRDAAQKMQQCFKNVDQKALDRLQQEGKEVETRIRQLCAAGNKEQARAAALDYAKKVNSSEEVRQMRKCGMMTGGMAGSMAEKLNMPEDKAQYGDICEGADGEQ